MRVVCWRASGFDLVFVELSVSAGRYRSSGLEIRCIAHSLRLYYDCVDTLYPRASIVACFLTSAHAKELTPLSAPTSVSSSHALPGVAHKGRGNPKC